MRASDRAYTQLRDEIMSAQLEPGTVLTEVEQSERLGVSRTPVREALNRLQADGLVASHRGRGMTVTLISMHVADELFDIRLAVEPLAVRRAAAALREPATDNSEFRTEFRNLAYRFRDAEQQWNDAEQPEVEDYYELTRQLDRAVDDACANPYLVQILTGLRLHLARLRRLSQHDPARLAASAGEHARVAEAIADGSPDLAEAASRLHLQMALEHLRRRINDDSDTETDTDKTLRTPAREDQR